ncbi:diguanylate cyclase (GGDEF)-like protein/PAS domain S-box-containing protein [Paenibacillus forsythiae]|uniref:Diguanylate cyclase (GGDEF)-like protein/PAS domain S-box-containing protein n=1 Tax=Paenibacillus forsythiae TaxID=365616 RepID=A0ABU3HBQ0_9BACL|nr:EAL domain-containing protein [Paenibacillus forsythiae]MDT3428211.1 diguanylate cyclase (GGDEF)-like protein/PAS domain S-box-containing protein [Paenibacillus forsythiae]
MRRFKIGLLLFILLNLLPDAADAARREVVYKAELDYPPYKYIQNEYLTGFDIDLTSMIFQKPDYLVRYGSDSWNRVYRQLSGGEIDTAGLMAVTEERKKKVLFSKPVMKIRISVYARQGLKEYVHPRDLGGYKIGVGEGHYSEDILRNGLGVSGYEAYPTVADALNALRRGDIDLLFENQSVVDYLIVEEGLTDSIVHKMRNLYSADMAYGISKASPELVSYINARLKQLKQSGVFEQLYQQYFFEHSEDYGSRMRLKTIAGIVVGCCLLTAGALLLRMYVNHLRRMIRAEQQFFQDAIEHTGILVWAVREDRTVLRLNKYGESVTGLREKEIIGKSLDDVEVEVVGGTKMKELLYRAVRQDFVSHVEFQIPDGGSEGRYFTFRTTLIKGLGGGNSKAYVLIGIDIDESKRNELELHSSYRQLEAAHLELADAKEELQDQNDKLSFSEQRFRLAVEASGAFLWGFDYKEQEHWVSERWYKVMGYKQGEIELSVETVLNLIHPDDRERSSKAREEHLAGLTPLYESEYRMRTKDGRYFWFEVRGKATYDSRKGIMLFLGSLIDISRRKQMELKLSGSYEELEATYEQLAATQQELVDQYDTLLENQRKMHHLAYFDSLSHLPNRLCLLETMEEYFDLPGGRAALLFVDTDNFKYINDTMGHKFGDILIRQVSERLQSTIVRDGSMLSRLGGDEFVVFLKNIEEHKEVLALAEQLLSEFRKPFEIGESSVYVSASIGISFYPEDGNTTEEILKNADMAMYRAKEAGKGIYAVYDRGMHTEFNERMMIEKHLRGALDNEEFELFYQPQVDLHTGAISGFEALIRWDSPVLGFVSPLSFIKIAEDSRLIIPIGEWVLRKACEFMSGLCRRQNNCYKIAVNISVIQLLQDDFIQTVLNVLSESEIPPGCLELEITETVFIESFERIVGKLEYLKMQGIRIALDDFGTGYSSLSYLQQLPITTLKMDKAFIDPLTEDSHSQSFIRTMVSLGHEMGLEVVAEGVEDSSQLVFLEEAGCDKVQGYLFSRPLSQRNTQELLRGHGYGQAGF